MTYIVDRIEEGVAVCESSAGERAEFLLQDMPQGMREGDVLVEESGLFRIDGEATEQRRAKLSKRLRGLFKDNSN